MKIPFTIYIRSVGMYALVTLPAIFLPIMYMISIFYVIIYGWFAWALFTIIYLMVDKFRMTFEVKMILLFIGIPVSVAFAFQMLEVFNVERNIWNSGSFLLFPMAATLSGWISLLIERKKTKEAELKILQTVSENNDIF